MKIEPIPNTPKLSVSAAVALVTVALVTIALFAGGGADDDGHRTRGFRLHVGYRGARLGPVSLQSHGTLPARAPSGVGVARAGGIHGSTQYVQARTHARTHARTLPARAPSGLGLARAGGIRGSTQYAHARTHARTHARMHACTHARTHACTHARMHPQAWAWPAL